MRANIAKKNKFIIKMIFSDVERLESISGHTNNSQMIKITTKTKVIRDKS